MKNRIIILLMMASHAVALDVSIETMPAYGTPEIITYNPVDQTIQEIMVGSEYPAETALHLFAIRRKFDNLNGIPEEKIAEAITYEYASAIPQITSYKLYNNEKLIGRLVFVQYGDICTVRVYSLEDVVGTYECNWNNEGVIWQEDKTITGIITESKIIFDNQTHAILEDTK